MYCQGIRDHPDAEFLSLKPRFEVRDQSIEEVFPGFVKKEEMRAPGHIAHYPNSRLSQLSATHRDLLLLDYARSNISTEGAMTAICIELADRWEFLAS